MEFKRIASPSLKKLFVSQIETMVLSGELEAGTQLPSERELAELMGVSRPVVNAGILEMAAKGFLEIKPRRGVFVCDYRRTGSLETLMSIMEYHGGLLPRREVRSLLEIHSAVLELSLKKSFATLSDEDVSELKRRLDALEASSTPQEAAERCYEFDHELNCLSGNSITPLLTHSFKQPCVALWAEYGRRHGIELLKEHRRTLWEHARDRDRNAAIAHLRQVFDDALEGSRQIYRD